jgi:hypothetical protein
MVYNKALNYIKVLKENAEIRGKTTAEVDRNFIYINFIKLLHLIKAWKKKTYRFSKPIF